jgi:ATP-dependent DNA ligase
MLRNLRKRPGGQEVVKRLGSLYRRGRSPHWIKVKIRMRQR